MFKFTVFKFTVKQQLLPGDIVVTNDDSFLVSDMYLLKDSLLVVKDNFKGTVSL